LGKRNGLTIQSVQLCESRLAVFDPEADVADYARRSRETEKADIRPVLVRRTNTDDL
jgi:hypothetical protein